MSKQKHTPYYYVDTQLGDRYCLMDGNDMSKDGAYRMLEEIKRVAELTKENERLKEANLIAMWFAQDKIDSLTEQVERMKAEVPYRCKSNGNCDACANERCWDLNECQDIYIELSRLREREKELVKALRGRMDSREEYDNEYFFLESLLSKFEV